MGLKCEFCDAVLEDGASHCPACGAGTGVNESFKFSCPFCGQHITVARSWGGRSARCPGCELKISIPIVTEERKDNSAERRLPPNPLPGRAGAPFAATTAEKVTAEGFRHLGESAHAVPRTVPVVAVPKPSVPKVSIPQIAGKRQPAASHPAAAEEESGGPETELMAAEVTQLTLPPPPKSAESIRRRRNFWLALLFLFLFALAVLLLIWGLGRAELRALRQQASVEQLQRIAALCRSYAAEHQGFLPAADQEINALMEWCALQKLPRSFLQSPLDSVADNCDYLLLAPGCELRSLPLDFPFLVEKTSLAPTGAVAIAYPAGRALREIVPHSATTDGRALVRFLRRRSVRPDHPAWEIALRITEKSDALTSR